jgi:excisionase family DNA binding protein
LLFDAESESFGSMKTGNMAQLELDGVANGIGADVGMESNRVDVAEAVASAAVGEAETSATKQVNRVDVAMRTPVRARSGNSRSVAAGMESLLTFAEAARVLGISLRQFRRLVDGGRVAFVKVSERTPRVRPSELQRFLDASAVKYSEVQS